MKPVTVNLGKLCILQTGMCTVSGLVASNEFKETLCLAESLDPQSFPPVNLDNRTAKNFSNRIVGTNLKYNS